MTAPRDRGGQTGLGCHLARVLSPSPLLSLLLYLTESHFSSDTCLGGLVEKLRSIIVLEVISP